MINNTSFEITGRFKLLPLNQVKPCGWIMNQLRRDLSEGFASILDELTTHASTDLFQDRINNNSEHMQWWDSETRGNWLLGYIPMAYLAGDDVHIQRVNDIVKSLKATQDSDGYIGIYTPESRYNHPPGENGELWSQGRALLILLSHYELSGDVSSFEAAERAAKLTISQYGPQHPYFVVQGSENGFSLGGLLHGLTYVDAMEWLYDLTGETTYRDFGVWLYDDFCQLPGNFTHDDMKLSRLMDPDELLSGHAAHPAEHLRTLIWSYFMTERPDMKEAIDHAFAKLARYTVPSGALIGDESIHGLPHPEFGYEYCTMFELMNSISNAGQKFGRVEFGDWIENIALNAAQGARYPNGEAISYLSTETRLQALKEMPDSYSNHAYRFDPTLAELLQADPHQAWQNGGRFKFSPTHEDVAVCCNPNAVRLMPHYTSKMWMRNSENEDLVAFLYGPSLLETEVNGIRLSIEQDTHYPFAETVTMKIIPEAPIAFGIKLRVPRWSTHTDVTADYARMDVHDGYIRVFKEWQAGDEIKITFSPNITAVLNTNGEYTVRRGPLQYALSIPHDQQPIKSYPVDGFHDYNLKPQSIRDAYLIIFLDCDEQDYGLTLNINRTADHNRPWDESPLQLQIGRHTLVPLGCTLLRRSTFPMIEK